jgi:hypothetical protein
MNIRPAISFAMLALCIQTSADRVEASQPIDSKAFSAIICAVSQPATAANARDDQSASNESEVSTTAPRPRWHLWALAAAAGLIVGALFKVFRRQS